jgi:hypothetical protein
LISRERKGANIVVENKYKVLFISGGCTLVEKGSTQTLSSLTREHFATLMKSQGIRQRGDRRRGGRGGGGGEGRRVTAKGKRRNTKYG